MQTERETVKTEQQPAEKFNSYNEFLRRFYPEPEKIDRARLEESGARRATITSYMTR